MYATFGWLFFFWGGVQQMYRCIFHTFFLMSGCRSTGTLVQCSWATRQRPMFCLCQIVGQCAPPNANTNITKEWCFFQEKGFRFVSTINCPLSQGYLCYKSLPTRGVPNPSFQLQPQGFDMTLDLLPGEKRHALCAGPAALRKSGVKTVGCKKWEVLKIHHLKWSPFACGEHIRSHSIHVWYIYHYLPTFTIQINQM